ncbi:thioredoxin [Nonlabens dokdonensis]|uniref:Thioredoxin n=1 Tax=Nonlabens dokdonensis TaxID=328515 RepID=A0A1Z8BB18_9FLAO|nr:thioredoxin [Nonlabens dokdonensis]OUS19783.1 thioredoxin [Nonlabens dokdonensis]
MSSFKEITNSDTPVLIDFFATWCGPCQTMMPVLDKLKEELGDNVRILKIDVDKNQALATKFQIRGVPAFMIFKNGKQIWKGAGVQPLHELKAQIDKAAAAV